MNQYPHYHAWMTYRRMKAVLLATLRNPTRDTHTQEMQPKVNLCEHCAPQDLGLASTATTKTVMNSFCF
eukprot:5357194-Amphidinium_carterae.1